LSGRRYRSQVENDQREAQQIGAHGTPFLIIDGRYTAPSAICTDNLRPSRPEPARSARSA
jgi:predicted DsbA family dithiol-disulfide isomerase